MPTSQRSGMGGPAPWHYLLWLAVGTLAGFGLLSVLTVGPVLLLGAAALGGLALHLRLLDRSAAALPAGLALAVVYLAWLNKDGPGDVCVSTGSGGTCVQEWNPLPIVIAAALLLGAAVLSWAVLPRVTRPVREPAPVPDDIA